MRLRRSPRGMVLAVMLAVGVAAAVVGCGGDSAAPTSSGAAPGLLGFRAPVVGTGGELDGATLAGAPVALWFWAPT